MKFSEVVNRLTGLSTPFGRASWQPTEMEIAAARRLIASLEDRRGHMPRPTDLLFPKWPSDLNASAIDIRPRSRKQTVLKNGPGRVEAIRLA